MTVVTHAPVIAAALVENEGVRLVTLGGQVDRLVGAALGGGVLAAVEAMRPDLLLLGACGIDAEAGITAHSLDDAAVKRAVAARAGRVAVAADRMKLGTAAPFAVMELAACDILCLEASTPPKCARGSRRAGRRSSTWRPERDRHPRAQGRDAARAGRRLGAVSRQRLRGGQLGAEDSRSSRPTSASTRRRSGLMILAFGIGSLVTMPLIGAVIAREGSRRIVVADRLRAGAGAPAADADAGTLDGGGGAGDPRRAGRRHGRGDERQRGGGGAADAPGDHVVLPRLVERRRR